MKQKEIIEGNKIIAEFNGYAIKEIYVQDWRMYGGGESTGYARKTTAMVKGELEYKSCDAPSHHNNPDVAVSYDNFVELNDLKYDLSWDWLMPVIEKINSLQQHEGAVRDLQYTIQYLLSGGYGFTEYERKKLPLTLKNLWERAVIFIKWYNTNKN